MTAESQSRMLEVAELTKSFGGITAINNVTMAVPAGAIIGVIGPNGAGKTSLFNVITGAYRPTTGDVRLDGQSIKDMPSHRIVRSGIARTFQNLRLFPSMTVWEHLLVAQPHDAGLLRRLAPTSWADPKAIGRAEEVLELFGLGSVRDRLAATLPYGIQRKVEMARALTARPRLLLLDEPVAGMNHDEAEGLRELLGRLRTDGLAILLIEHDMTFVMNLVDYLYVLDFGSLIAEGKPQEIQRNEAVLDAYLGREE